MIDRVRALILEIAGQKAAHDGVPVAPVHIHAAGGEAMTLVMQVRDRLMGSGPGAPGHTIPLAYGEQRVAPNLLDHQSFQEPAAQVAAAAAAAYGAIAEAPSLGSMMMPIPAPEPEAETE